ncbi:hypothetical protein Q0Z83_041320 [Actinoplanes sichuanensis]|uniref:Lycopene cyclase domain-containing protein n=1 Tax=Actinoplanes sichuanensis TaxID=512349 RepID=A0ABW4ARW1_9ACTN|nr:hypothetical protein [Actinoplanes sichuanensis]BEL05941.1 hypothetical protein Q0Z83_041320 [Actinoplanes sichuanensis]
MVLQWWHLAVVVAVGALIIWGVRVSRQRTLLGVAAALVVLSGFLLYTLVLEEEPYLESDLNGQLETVALIGIPAILGVVLFVVALRRAGTRRA